MKNPFRFNFYKAYAFMKRDFIEEASYKLAFLGGIFHTFLSLVMYFFLSKLFGAAINPYLKPYGGDYFSFVMVGTAFTGYISLALSGFRSTIERAQTTGTLEALLVTRTSVPTVIISSTLYGYIRTSINVIIYILMGVLFFNVRIKFANSLPALIILILTILSFCCIGVLSASFILMFKRGDPITGLFMSASFLFGGVVYPTTVLPAWLKKISFFLPLTHSLEGARLSLLKGYSLYDIRVNALFLLAFSMVMFPLSVAVFKYAIRKAKIEGSLIKY